MPSPGPPPARPPNRTANKDKTDELEWERWGNDTWGRWQHWQNWQQNLQATGSESHEWKGEKEEDVKEDVKGEPFLDDDHDWHEEINCYRWWVAFGPEESGEKEEVKEEVKEFDLVKEEEEDVSDEAEGEKDDEHMPGDDASYVSSEEVDGFDLLHDDLM